MKRLKQGVLGLVGLLVVACSPVKTTTDSDMPPVIVYKTFVKPDAEEAAKLLAEFKQLLPIAQAKADSFKATLPPLPAQARRDPSVEAYDYFCDDFYSVSHKDPGSAGRYDDAGNKIPMDQNFFGGYILSELWTGIAVKIRSESGLQYDEFYAVVQNNPWYGSGPPPLRSITFRIPTEHCIASQAINWTGSQFGGMFGWDQLGQDLAGAYLSQSRNQITSISALGSPEMN